MRSRVSLRTPGLLFSTRETVEVATPATSDISLSVISAPPYKKVDLIIQFDREKVHREIEKIKTFSKFRKNFEKIQ